MKRHQRQSDGKFHVKGKTYPELVGSRAQVWHGNAYKTTGGLTKSDLLKNKHDRIVSAKKHATAKKERRLVKAGYVTKKGKFGAVKTGKAKRRTSKRRTRRRR
jgi:hypothetical protein